MYKIKNKMGDKRKIRVNNCDVVLEPFEVIESMTPISDELLNVFGYVEDERVDFDDLTVTIEPIKNTVTNKTKKRGN